MNELLTRISKKYRALLKKKKMPNFEQPMLATLTKNHFSSSDWIYERKFDGLRCLIFKNKNNIFLKSRNDKNISESYPEIVDAAKKWKVDQIIVDGEIITFDGKVSSFEKLQPRIGVKNPSAALMKKVKIYVYIFDILYCDGHDVTKLPLIQRKNLLKKAIKSSDPIRYVTHRNTQGIPLFKQACAKGWEGLIAKQRESTYVHVRSQQWLKFKCINEQELVVGGYTDPQGSRIGFGSLLLGFFKQGKFVYCGKVGTGFNEEFLREFSKKMKPLKISKNPFTNTHDIDEEHVHFIKPKLVVEIGFEEWTKHNKLRQPRFLGVRPDKAAKDVVQERPKKVIPKPIS